MILIISDPDDNSTIKVTSWLDYFCVSYLVISETTIIQLDYLKIEVESCEYCINFNGIKIHNYEISKIWYRRSKLSFVDKDYFNRLYSKVEQAKEIVDYCKIEYDNIIDFFWYFNRDKIALNSYLDTGLNKLTVLDTAKKCGLLIPATLISGNKNEVLNFYTKEEEVICKSIYNNPNITLGNKFFFSYNFKIDSIFFSNLPDQFGFTLFQKYIQKQFEVRTFFIDNDFFSMAIFSQGNSNTNVDFRNYDYKKMNRFAAFSLPRRIMLKIKKMIKILDLKSGSVDFIVDPLGDFYFLEINPVGQYGMVSYPCNYYLDKQIALNLIYQ